MTPDIKKIIPANIRYFVKSRKIIKPGASILCFRLGSIKNAFLPGFECGIFIIHYTYLLSIIQLAVDHKESNYILYISESQHRCFVTTGNSWSQVMFATFLET